MNQANKTDIGDYLKVFACSGVILQAVLSFAVKTSVSVNNQIGIGLIYNLVKFTAPAFIFGILYTTIRTHPDTDIRNYPVYIKKQWHTLFIPTILWTSCYLLLMPQLQQHKHFTNFFGFCWQFINGNAAPHLWYSTMMLQFIILMPFFWWLSHYVQYSFKKGLIVFLLTSIIYSFWIWLYDRQVFHGPHMQNWYLLDRIFISFIIYAVCGTLAWNFRKQFSNFLHKFYWLVIIAGFSCYYWINQELFSFGFPIKLANATYYKPSMTIYCLLIICLISAFAYWQIKRQQLKSLHFFHFLAVYAYRAFLSHIFWLKLEWQLFGKRLLQSTNLFIAILILYILTWLISFTSAYYLHIFWQQIKTRLLTA